MMTDNTVIRQKNDDQTSPLLAASTSTSYTREQLLTIFEQLPAGVIILDNHGVVTGYNPIAADLLGQPLYSQSWWQIIQRAFTHTGEQAGDLCLEDGRVVNLQTCPLGNRRGQIILCHEVTEVRALEGRIKRYQQLSQSGELAARLAHQIRTPLSAALLYCDQMIEVNLSVNKRTSFAQKLKARLMNIESHVKDMMLLVNVPSAQELATVNYATLFKGLMSQIDQSCVKVNWSGRDDHHCKAHLPSLIGAINNCINNAIGANATVIHLNCSEINQGLLISIQDNGAGMPKSICEQASQPFYTTKKQGTGLGLAVVQSVITAHNGKMNLISEKNHGTTVELILPAMEKA